MTTAGSIGFVGLIVPHMLRLVLGNDQRIILPASALAGGTFAGIGRYAGAHGDCAEQLPVGYVITALLGVPTFLYLLAPEPLMSILQTRDLIINVPSRADGSRFSMSIESGTGLGRARSPMALVKTTLLHTLAGLPPARSGQVILNETSLVELKRRAIARQLGLFQERQDSFPATVLETALIGRHPWLSPWQSEQTQTCSVRNRLWRQWMIIYRAFC